MIIRKLVTLLLDDLSRAWQPVYAIEGEYLRTEINPQFLAVVPPSDVVVLTSFELEMENLRGTVQVVIPYSTIEPIRQHLSSGIQAESMANDNTWYDQIGLHLRDVPVETEVLLGTSKINIRDLLALKPGDVIALDQPQTAKLRMFVAGSPKFEVTPVESAGHLAAQVVAEVERPKLPERKAPEAPALEDQSS